MVAIVNESLAKHPTWHTKFGHLLIRAGERIAQENLRPTSYLGSQPKIADSPSRADDHEERRENVLQLIKRAMEAPTPQEFVNFLQFVHRFRRLAIWNARMAYIQRPGATVIATEAEWARHGRNVKPDAIPILILWPFGPIAMVYELEDTLPPIDRAAFKDPFAVEGSLPPNTLLKLNSSLAKQKHFRIEIDYQRLGYHLAGRAARHGTAPIIPASSIKSELSIADGDTIGELAHAAANTETPDPQQKRPLFHVRLNDQLSPVEAFATLAHELGHIFCGHLGGCQGHGTTENDQSGWPDRRALRVNEREVEAEAVSYLVTARAGILTRSAEYLTPHVSKVGTGSIDVDLVVRAAARIERLAELHHGTMAITRSALLPR